MTPDEENQTMAMMQSIARSLDEVLNGPLMPKVHGFALLVFPFDQLDGGMVNYISNGDRKDVITALKQIIARLEGQADVPRTVQ